MASTSRAISSGPCSTTSNGASGYTQHFGLVQVDRDTMQRRPKASYYWYGDVAKSNEVPL